MSASKYHDLLWDFTVAEGRRQEDSRQQESGKWQYQDRWQGAVRLRVFTSEEQLFEARDDPSMAHDIILQLDWSPYMMDGNIPWLRSQPDESWLRMLGQQLWDVIPLSARQPLLEGTHEHPCRLKISSNSSAIDDLPWEWMNDGEGPPFALHPGVRLARSMPVRVPSPPLDTRPPLRVLLVITNPKDDRLLDPQREIAAIQPRLSKRPYKLQILGEPTWEALVEALRQEPHIVHYIGHAGIDRGIGNLILHDEQDVTHWIPGGDLAKVLPLSVRLLCLSTCFTAQNYQILGLSRLAHTPAGWRLPTMVTNRYPVGEAGVQAFWYTFYGSLAKHSGNAVEAFYQAQQSAAKITEAGTDWGSFSLVIRDQTGQGLRLQKSRSPAKSAERKRMETQAQIASQLANELAQTLRSYGDTPPESVQKVYKELASKASSEMEEQL